jgi:hypothetical protein
MFLLYCVTNGHLIICKTEGIDVCQVVPLWLAGGDKTSLLDLLASHLHKSLDRIRPKPYSMSLESLSFARVNCISIILILLITGSTNETDLLAACRREGKPPFFLPPGPRGWHTKPSCAPPGGRNGANNQCSTPYFCSLRQTARSL